MKKFSSCKVGYATSHGEDAGVKVKAKVFLTSYFDLSDEVESSSNVHNFAAGD